MSTKELPTVVALLIAGVWSLALPTGASSAQRQASPLKGPQQVTECDGSTVGKTVIKHLANGGTKLKVKFTHGPAHQTFQVQWTCTNVSGGCHSDACGFLNAGQITTDGTGKGVFKFTFGGGNPYPGKFVHIDVSGAGLFTSTFGAVPAVSAPVTAGASAGAGDPTR